MTSSGHPVKFRHMIAYRFIAKVSDSGVIQIPQISSLSDQEVEIIILPKAVLMDKPTKAMAFVEKWAGFLTAADSHDEKLSYLSEKYR